MGAFTASTGSSFAVVCFTQAAMLNLGMQNWLGSLQCEYAWNQLRGSRDSSVKNTSRKLIRYGNKEPE